MLTAATAPADVICQQEFEVQAKDGKAQMARVAKEVAMFREIIGQVGIKQM